MKTNFRLAFAGAALACALPAAAQIAFYEHEGFQGRSFETQQPVQNFRRQGYPEHAESVIVTRGRWEVCEGRRFEGRCVVLRRGQYPSLQAMGLGDRVMSVRPVPREARAEQLQFAPPPVVQEDYRRRRGEQLFQADVTDVRAVVGPPERRCWVESQQVQSGPSGNQVGGTIAGAVIGGILGHQVGSGRGNDLATALGAVAGGAIGNNVARDDAPPTYQQNVRRCENVQSSGPPAYYDVTYHFRGRDYRVQMATPPGRSVTVNGNGEPRAG
jgi:uncharacterized protein YcfJ